MGTTTVVPTPTGEATVVFTDRTDGDLAVGSDGDPAEHRRRLSALAGDRPVGFGQQVHGADLIVGRPPSTDPPSADGVILSEPDVAAAVFVADCAPVILVGPEPTVAAVHAGWRGLAAGIIEAAVRQIAGDDPSEVRALLGPCIGPCCYEFGAAELNVVADRYGEAVRATTTDGRPALDMVAGVTAALGAAGVAADRIDVSGHRCTAHHDHWWSHRASGDRQRQAGLVWWSPR